MAEIAPSNISSSIILHVLANLTKSANIGPKIVTCWTNKLRNAIEKANRCRRDMHVQAYSGLQQDDGGSAGLADL
jgi:hypothetical protein